MAINRKPIFIGVPFTLAANTQIANKIVVGDTTTKKVVITGATDGSVVQDLIASSSTANAKALDVWFDDGTNDEWHLGQVVIPASAGYSTTPSVSVLNTTDIPSLAKRDDGSILLAAGQTLSVSAVATVEAAQVITIVALGGNLTA